MERNENTGNYARNILRPSALLLILSLALLAGGCTKEPDGESNGPEEPGGQVRVGMTFTPDAGQQIQVKAIDPAGINTITDLWVVQLNENGTGQLQAPDYLSGSEFTSSGDDYMATIELTAQPCCLYLIANTHNSKAYTAANSKDKVEAVTRTGITKESDLTTKGVPMSAYWEGTPSGTMNITLFRAVSKVNFKLRGQLPPGETFTLTSIQVHQVPQTLHYWRDYSKIPVDPTIDPSYPTNPYPNSTFVDYPIKALEGKLGSIEHSFMWYLPENARGSGSATDQKHKTKDTAPSGQSGFCTYIEIRGNYVKPDIVKNISYKFFLGANNTTDYNLLRNREYTVTTRILGINLTDTRIEDVTPGFDYTDNKKPWFIVAEVNASSATSWTDWMTGEDSGTDNSRCPAGWRTPTQQEMMLMYVFRTPELVTPGDGAGPYWTATKYDGAKAWYVNLTSGATTYLDKNDESIIISGSSSEIRVRCIRNL